MSGKKFQKTIKMNCPDAPSTGRHYATLRGNKACFEEPHDLC